MKQAYKSSISVAARHKRSISVRFNCILRMNQSYKSPVSVAPRVQEFDFSSVQLHLTHEAGVRTFDFRCNTATKVRVQFGSVAFHA